jgi:integrase
MKKRFTDADVAALKAHRKRYAERDPEMSSHYVRVTPNGTKSFWAVARDKTGKQKWMKVGDVGSMTIAESRVKALGMIGSIRDTVIADPVCRYSFTNVADDWWNRHVIGNGVIRAACIRTHLDRAKAAFGDAPFTGVKRTQISTLLDKVEDAHGKHSADALLRVLASLCGWYATRNEGYASPIIKGMRRSKDVARTRILNDKELKELWQAEGRFGQFCRLALLTAQRKEKIARMKWSDISDDNIWTIPGSVREKGTAGALVLSEAILEVLRGIPRQGDYVFSEKGLRSYLHREKAKFDAEHQWSPWTIHDLRRTSRSLLAKSKVAEVVSEAILGHRQGGVVGVYNCHDYQQEMGDALEVLAAAVRDIVTPPPANVVPMRAA